MISISANKQLHAGKKERDSCQTLCLFIVTEN